ncbi:CapA family protein [Bacteroides galacturonicus]|nr:capsule synthesis protein PGA_cap [Bacteroides galacturonicus]
MRKSIVKNALKKKSAVIIAVIISVLFVSGCGKSSGVSNNDVLDTSEVSTREETTVDTHPFDITMTFTGDINIAEGEPTTKMWTFRAGPERAKVLNALGVDVAQLANNHVYDYGQEAMYDTFSALEAVGIPYVGAGRTLEEAMKPYYTEVDGKKIAIVAASRAEKYKMTPQATDTTPGILRCYDTELFVQTIKEARANADYVVAVVHWGTEHTTVLEDVQRSSAREYIDAGADVIIGGHSHCLQGIEYYEDKPIFYSLGNFWFDEYNVDTMLVNIRISGNDYGDKIDVSVVPAVQDGTLQGCVTHICTQEEDKSRIFSLLNKVSINANVADDGTVTQVK